MEETSNTSVAQCSTFYDNTTVARILQERPSDVPSLLRELHSRKEDTQRLQFVKALASVLNDSEQYDLWHILAQNGLRRVLTDILQDETLCGYTSSEVMQRYRRDVQMQVSTVPGDALVVAED